MGVLGQCLPPITEVATSEDAGSDDGNNDGRAGRGEEGRGELAKWKDIGEIKFMTDSGESHINSGANEKLWCKIKCIDGEWVGPLCSSNGGITLQFHSTYSNHYTLRIQH